MFVLPDLPYAHDALQPVISAETMRFHHDKHHASYVKTVNELVAERGGGDDTLEQVVAAAFKADDAKLFNNAAQAWNHAFFWACMSPSRVAPAGDLLLAITAAFGGLDGLKTAFVKAGVGHFGSGWVWLVADDDRTLKVIATHDAHCPLTDDGVTALLVCDVWEHAYYIDYRNDRKAYLERWFDALPNWCSAAEKLAAAGPAGGR